MLGHGEKLTAIQDLFNAFTPMETFPPRTTNAKLKASAKEHLESGILLRDHRYFKRFLKKSQKKLIKP